MTKQEQIKEIAKYICNVCDFKCDSFLLGGFCAFAQETAESIYSAWQSKDWQSLKEY